MRSVIGTVIGVGLVLAAVSTIMIDLHGESEGTVWERIVRNFGGELLALAVVAIFLLLLMIAVRPSKSDKRESS